MFTRKLLNGLNKSAISRWTPLHRSMLTLSSLSIDPSIQSYIKDDKPILPVDTSIFMFNDNVEENIRFIRIQMEIGKKLRMRVAPCALINGKLKVGLNNEDFAVIRSQPGVLSECSLNTIETMMKSGDTGYCTTSVTTMIASLIHCPVAVSGFVRGLEKDSPSTSADIETLRKTHVTNLSCGFDVTTDIYSTVPFLISNEMNVVTPGCQYITSVNNRLLKVKSNITTYSYSELATLLLNNEQMHFPSSYMVGIHIKDTTRTAKLEKLMPSVFYESQRKTISFTDRSRFIHNCLNEKSNGLSKSLYCSCLKEITKSGVLLLKSLEEQKNILHLKSILHEEQKRSETQGKEKWEETEKLEKPVFPEETISLKEKEANQEESYITLFANTNLPQSGDPSNSLLSSSYFRSCISPSSPTLNLPAYASDSPVFIGEIATGVYNQASGVATRPSLIFRDVGGVMRNIYEVFLRQNPTKRPYLIGVIGKDEEGEKIIKYHEMLGDSLVGVRRVSGKTTRICGIYSKEGICEREYRLETSLKGVEEVDIRNNQQRIQSSSLVCVDTSITPGAMNALTTVLADTPNILLVDPSHTQNNSSFLQSGLLRRTDFLLPSIPELWKLACLLEPSLEGAWHAWQEIVSKNPSLQFHEAILNLREPLKCVMKEMTGEKDHFIILKMKKMGMAMICQNAGDDFDVIHFNIDKTFVPSFESHIAYEEAFTGGLLYGLVHDYPMNLCMALGINTLRVNSRQKRIIADSINESIHNYFIKTYMKQLWG